MQEMMKTNNVKASNRFKVYPSSLGWDIIDELKEELVLNHNDKIMANILCEVLNNWNERIDGECASNEAYDRGYDDGHEDGEDYGYDKGYDEGYEDGKEDSRLEEY